MKYRAFVMAGKGRMSGHWIAAYRYSTTSGTKATKIAGGPFVYWNAAARLAVSAAALAERIEPVTVTPKQKQTWDNEVETARFQKAWRRCFEIR